QAPCAATSPIEVHPMTGAWSDQTSVPALMALMSPSVVASGYQGNGATGLTHDFNVTAELQRWVSGADGRFGFGLRTQNEALGGGGSVYYSDAGATSNNAPPPSLTVTYTGGIALTPTRQTIAAGGG